MRQTILALLIACSLTLPAGAAELSIEPVYQQTPVWCWAAVGEMVFRYYGVEDINPAGNFQCGIIALLHPVCNANCGNCVVPAGSLSTMNNMITGYPAFASRVTHTSTRLTTAVRRSRLPFDEVQTEIDEGRPVIAGISPSGYRGANVSQHVALIVGYDDEALIVNDPFPFGAAFTGDPYEAAGGEQVELGQYRIDYDAFVSKLHWRETIYDIECTGDDCAGGDALSDEGDEDDLSDDDDAVAEDDPRPSVQYGHSCLTPLLQCGPFPAQPMPVGSQCWCGTPAGPVYGRVVQP